MGKSLVEHQMPAPVTGSGKESDNNHMNSSSASFMATAALPSASRDVFQGLFLDLGKQAMAMEAVLRLICGKVDSMEVWMTEVAFGMTELDLKLRNIAHNIEGTAANVDDEAANVHRWAAPPPPEDDRAHVPATVKKKLGPNKKGLKVSEMVAAVIDTLSIPADERDSAVFSASATAATEVAIAISKRKHSGASMAKKLHHKKKPKDDKLLSKDTVAVTDGPAVGGADEETEKLVVDEQVTNDAENGVQEGPDPLRETQPSVPVLPEQSQVYQEATIATDHDTGRSLDSERAGSEESKGGTTGHSVDSKEKLKPAREEASDLGALKAEEALAESATDKEQPKQQVQEVVEAPALVEMSQSATQPPPVAQHNDIPAESQSDVTWNTPAPVEAPSPTPGNAAPVVPEPVSRFAVVTDGQLQLSQEQTLVPVSESSAGSGDRVEKSKSQPPPQKESISASGSYLPPPPQYVGNATAATLGFQLSSSAFSDTSAPASNPDSPPAADQPPSPSVSAPGKLAKKRSSKKQMGSVESTTSKPALMKKKSSRKALEAAMRKASSRTKSYFESSTPKPAAADDSGHEQVPANPPTKANTVTQSQVVSSNATTQQEETGKDPRKSTKVDAKDSDDDDESSSEDNDSDSSSSSESNNQDEAEGHREELGAATSSNVAVKNAARRLSKMPGPTSKMTRTITALKKLKEANMITPEEEEEFKQRAQEKWFKLKGHVKEKKKKDVANILLKRKKNVFTVSARIELLEEKSKEVFASIKQITNDLKTKTDVSATETLRRQVFDINLSLQALDHKITHGAAPAMERVVQLGKEVELVRASFSQQLVFVNEDIAATKFKLAASGDEHRNQLELLNQSLKQQLENLVEEQDAKVRDLPDHSAAIEGLKRVLRRKADLKLLKELESRLLGQDTEPEDCLVRCLSCHKEVVNTATPDATNDSAPDESGERYLKKVNPGPSSGKIYRSNVPFSAQLMGAYESIPEDSAQTTGGDSYFAERPGGTLTGLAPSLVPRGSTVRRDESKVSAGTTPPIRSEIWLFTYWSEGDLDTDLFLMVSLQSSIQIKASRATMSSPDRPISAPAATLKKKTPYLKSKEKQPAAPPK